MSPHACHFLFLVVSELERVWLADDSFVRVVGKGDVMMDGPGGPVILRDVQFVPDLTHPLLSVAAVYDHGGRVQFAKEACGLYSQGATTPCITAVREGSGWYVNEKILLDPQEGQKQSAEILGFCLCAGCSGSPIPHGSPSDSGCRCTISRDAPGDDHCLFCSECAVSPDVFAKVVRGADADKAQASWQLWHARFGYLGWKQLKHLFNKDLAGGCKVEGEPPADQVCHACLEVKINRHPFHPAGSRATEPLELVHTDLMGPIEVPSAVGKNRYILVLVDDYTRYAWVYFLRRKSEAPKRVRQFFAYAERQFGKKIKRVRSDRGGEFLAEELTAWFADVGVVHDLSLPRTPQQNGVAERYNRTVCDRARTMLLAAGLPVRFWEHSVRYACWLTNRLPTSALEGDVSPYFALRGQVPNLARAKVFGCLAHVWTQPGLRGKKRKFGPRAQWAVFIGIPPESKGWELFIPATGEVGHLSRDVHFHEGLRLKVYVTRMKASPDGSRVPEPDTRGVGVDPYPGEGWDFWGGPMGPARPGEGNEPPQEADEANPGEEQEPDQLLNLSRDAGVEGPEVDSTVPAEIRHPVGVRPEDEPRAGGPHGAPETLANPDPGAHGERERENSSIPAGEPDGPPSEGESCDGQPFIPPDPADAGTGGDPSSAGDPIPGVGEGEDDATVSSTAGEASESEEDGLSAIMGSLSLNDPEPGGVDEGSLPSSPSVAGT